jgi:outer membrane protein
MVWMKNNWFRGLLFGAAVLAVGSISPGSALADTLNRALEKAYSTNPTLNSARAGQRANDELVPQALSGWRPDVQIVGQLQSTFRERNTASEQRHFDQGAVSIQLAQPLFRGFRTVEGTKAAEARVDAGRQNLLQTEQQVLFSVVEAYMNVYANRQLVNLQKRNVSALQGQLGAANERFKVGEITRTDVAQARARLAVARSDLEIAQGNLATSVSQYLQVVGNEPGKLNYPKIIGLPKTLKSALAAAGEINPQLLASAFVEAASNFDVNVERGRLLPEASLTADASYTDEFDDKATFFNSNKPEKRLTASLNVTVPLYPQGGAVYSAIRQAKQLASQRKIEVIEVARAVRQAVSQSWAAYVAYVQIIKNARTGVSAAELALSGVQQEYQAGTRTTLDVLDAQQELVQAQVTLVNAERNRVIAGYQLLSSIGHLTARDLKLNVALYDVDENYRRVRNKWFGTGVETVE